MSQQRNLLDDLSFTEHHIPEITKDDAVMLIDASNVDVSPEEVLAVWNKRIHLASFIEQKYLNGRLNTGSGVTATLPDGSMWMRERNLTDTERIQLELEGFMNHTLMTESLLSTRH
jgi:hypothetical protein